MIKKCVSCGSDSLAEGQLRQYHARFIISRVSAWNTFWFGGEVVKGGVCRQCGFVNLFLDPQRIKELKLND